MAEQQTGFAYHNIQLYKSESLGSGSYGGVCKAKCDGLLCAAKIMHPTLFDLRDPLTDSYLRKFQEECHLLSLARHPNVVQYLATYYDPDTRLPVLLMELCDESLTAFLERSPGPLSYYIQLNICLDIAQALVYLHSNCLIHRDLTGNNVLMIGTRAKITDFGMSKLATSNPRMTALTLCPGNLLYMSPEALDQAKSYTAKLDIFSFGVIVIQILTREFPNPTDRFRTVYVSQLDEEVRMLVPETERRQAHFQLIPDTHSLKPLAIQCLKKEIQRPSAHQLSEMLSELKQAPQYTESMHQPQNSSEIQQLEQQLHRQIEAKTREASEHQTRSTQLQSMVEAKDRQLQEKQQIIDAKDRQLQENQRTISTKQHAIEIKERQVQQTQEQLRDSQHILCQFQEILQQKEMFISDLQLTISNHESEIQQMKQQELASIIQLQQLPVAAQNTQITTAVSAVPETSREETNLIDVSEEPAERQEEFISEDVEQDFHSDKTRVQTNHSKDVSDARTRNPEAHNTESIILQTSKHITRSGYQPAQQSLPTSGTLSPLETSQRIKKKKTDVKELDLADIEFGNLLGQGGNGCVFRGVWRSKNMRVALKKVNMSSKCCDTDIMAKLGEHPNIISFYGFAKNYPEKIIVTALAENGSLYNYLHEKKETPTLEQSLTWAKQIAYGMAYMHQLDLVHRDLKSSNVLFTDEMTAQICDFGTSRTMKNTTIPSKTAGTYRWMAPEVAKMDDTNKSCDIFSYSIVVWELIEHEIPFRKCPTDVTASLCILNDERPCITSPAWPQFLIDLVQVGWSANPRERPTFFDILTSLKNKVFFMIE